MLECPCSNDIHRCGSFRGAAAAYKIRKACICMVNYALCELGTYRLSASNATGTLVTQPHSVSDHCLHTYGSCVEPCGRTLWVWPHDPFRSRSAGEGRGPGIATTMFQDAALRLRNVTAAVRQGKPCRAAVDGPRCTQLQQRTASGRPEQGLLHVPTPPRGNMQPLALVGPWMVSLATVAEALELRAVARLRVAAEHQWGRLQRKLIRQLCNEQNAVNQIAQAGPALGRDDPITSSAICPRMTGCGFCIAPTSFTRGHCVAAARTADAGQRQTHTSKAEVFLNKLLVLRWRVISVVTPRYAGHNAHRLVSTRPATTPHMAPASRLMHWLMSQ